MTGGVFEGSNSQATGYVTLATVASASDTAWTTLTVTGASAYRYLRYRGPNGGFCNVAEIEFRGGQEIGGRRILATRTCEVDVHRRAGLRPQSVVEGEATLQHPSIRCHRKQPGEQSIEGDRLAQANE